ncbi:DUF4222 domain-containing protein [Klebsiella aerogenes]
MAQWINNLTASSVASVPAFTASSVTMSSREIAELTEKQHGHVCRDIEVMLKQLGEKPEGYIQLWTHPQNGQKYREYRLDREHTECLITGYSAVLRMKIIRRQRVIYRRPGYEWECVAPMIIFRARFKRIDK